jgi:hypothetical protein
MVACLTFAVPIWMRNGYRFWIPGREIDSRENIRQAPGKKEVCSSVCNEFYYVYFFVYLDKFRKQHSSS